MFPHPYPQHTWCQCLEKINSFVAPMKGEKRRRRKNKINVKNKKKKKKKKKKNIPTEVQRFVFLLRADSFSVIKDNARA